MLFALDSQTGMTQTVKENVKFLTYFVYKEMKNWIRLCFRLVNLIENNLLFGFLIEYVKSYKMVIKWLDQKQHNRTNSALK